MPIHNEQFLPAELQAQIGDMRAAGVADSLLGPLITALLAQLEAKTTKVQLDVWRIEESLGERMERAVAKQDADLRSQLGETNGMLSELLRGQQTQGAATEQLRAEFQQVGERLSEIEGWQPQVEAELASFRESRDQSREQRTRTERAVEELSVQFERFVGEIHTLIAQGPTPERQAQYRAFLDELMREKQAGS